MMRSSTLAANDYASLISELISTFKIWMKLVRQSAIGGGPGLVFSPLGDYSLLSLNYRAAFRCRWERHHVGTLAAKQVSHSCAILLENQTQRPNDKQTQWGCSFTSWRNVPLIVICPFVIYICNWLSSSCFCFSKNRVSFFLILVERPVLIFAESRYRHFILESSQNKFISFGNRLKYLSFFLHLFSGKGELNTDIT